MKDEWSCVTIRDGGLCVMMDGQLLTFKLCAGNLAIVHKVCIFNLFMFES